MLAREPHPPSGTRRAIDALGSTIADMAPGERLGRLPDFADWRESLLRNQLRVISHYRHLLATHRMPDGERNAIEGRIARIETELRSLADSGDTGSQPVQVEAA
jgi:hypothetical protein